MDLFELTRTLVDIESVTGRERAVGDFLFGLLERLAVRTGGVVERLPVDGERFNLFASWGTPAVVFSTHLDTVPPFVPASEDAAHIWGRGACDTKGAIAAMVHALAALLDGGAAGLGLLLVVGEETDSIGATAANQTPRGSRFLINGEPTENRLALGSKGALYLELVAEGRMAHSAYPELGVSAIDRLLVALDRLREVELPADPVLGATTVNIGTLSGGRAPNVVADQARAEVMIRTVGDTARLHAGLAAALAVPDVRVARTREVPAVRLAALPGFETTVVKYTTDVPRLDRWGTPFLLGPGSIHVAHTPDERVPKEELVAAVELYRELAWRLLQGEVPAVGDHRT
jgi:acetylornithine deacetylase